jgi:hypothetical protein
MWTYEYYPPFVGILLDSSAKQLAVIRAINPPIRNEMNTDGPAIGKSIPIIRKKFDPMLAPSP